MSSRAAALAVVAAACALSACAVRYDASGVSRVGVFLWGFGDPPGVDWNLDGPRSAAPELPAPQRSELPPRREAPRIDLPPRRESGPGAIDDNRARETHRMPESPDDPVARGAGDRGGPGARR